MFPYYIFKGDKAYLLTEGTEEIDLNKVQIGYVIASNGLFLVNNNLGHNILRKEEEVTGLSEIKKSVTYNYPIVSYDVYRKALEFLRQVYEEHKSEGNIILLLDRTKALNEQEYQMYIPEQKVSGGSVDYKIDQADIPENMFQAGSIHSHPNFGAFQSGVDHKDEMDWDGPHITFGHIKRDVPDIHGRLILGGEKYEYKLDGKTRLDLITIIPEEKKVEIPEDWMKQVSTTKGNITVISGNNIRHGHYGDRRQYNNGENYLYNTPITPIKVAALVRTIFKTMKPKNLLNQSNAKKLKDVVPFQTMGTIGFEQGNAL